jgi:hypothetical protein
MLKNKLLNFALVVAVSVVAGRLLQFLEKHFVPRAAVGQCFVSPEGGIKFKITKNDYVNGVSEIDATTYGINVHIQGTFEELKEMPLIKGPCNEIFH